MSLDDRGIYLSEVNNKYPKIYQSIGYDVLLDTDDMYKPKVISSFETCINSLLTLLFMKPGQYPSIPELGIDIESYLHEYNDDDRILMDIEEKIKDQCNRIELIGIHVKCRFSKTSDGFNALLVEVVGTERLGIGSESNQIIIGITYDKLNRLYARRIYV